MICSPCVPCFVTDGHNHKKMYLFVWLLKQTVSVLFLLSLLFNFIVPMGSYEFYTVPNKFHFIFLQTKNLKLQFILHTHSLYSEPFVFTFFFVFSFFIQVIESYFNSRKAIIMDYSFKGNPSFYCIFLFRVYIYIFQYF